MTRLHLVLAALALAACGGDDKGTASEGGSTTQVDPSTTGEQVTTSGGTTSDEASDGTTASTVPPTSDGTTTDESTTTTEAPVTTTTEGGETNDETTGGGDAYDASCTSACATILMCFPNQEFYTDEAECQQACSFGANDDPGCRAAGATFNECVAAQDCDAVLEGLINEDYGSCQDEADAWIAACM